MVIYRHKEKYLISGMCRFFNVSRSGYYDYIKRFDIPAKDLPLAEKIKECQDKCGKNYGYRRVHIWLERQGIHYNPETIFQVMQKYNLLSEVRRKKYRNYGNGLHKFDDLFKRDLYDNSIVAYKTGTEQNVNLVLSTIRVQERGKGHRRVAAP